MAADLGRREPLRKSTPAPVSALSQGRRRNLLQQAAAVLLELIGRASAPGRCPFNVDFSASTDTGRELYVTDGTFGGTGLLLDIETGAGSSNPNDFILVGDTIFFSATNSANGTELWKTDGTAAGTTRVTDLGPGTDGSSPDLIGAVEINTVPTGLDLSASSVAENGASNTVIGTFSEPMPKAIR